MDTINQWQRIPVFCTSGKTQYIFQRYRRFKTLVAFSDLEEVSKYVGAINQSPFKILDSDLISTQRFLITSVHIPELTPYPPECIIQGVERRNESWLTVYNSFGQSKAIEGLYRIEDFKFSGTCLKEF